MNLRSERRSLVKWLLDESFGRLVAMPGQVATAIRRIVTINKRIGDR